MLSKRPILPELKPSISVNPTSKEVASHTEIIIETFRHLEIFAMLPNGLFAVPHSYLVNYTSADYSVICFLSFENQTIQCVDILKTNDNVHSLLLHPNGSLMVSHRERVTQWDIQNKKLLYTIETKKLQDEYRIKNNIATPHDDFARKAGRRLILSTNHLFVQSDLHLAIFDLDTNSCIFFTYAPGFWTSNSILPEPYIMIDHSHPIISRKPEVVSKKSFWDKIIKPQTKTQQTITRICYGDGNKSIWDKTRKCFILGIAKKTHGDWWFHTYHHGQFAPMPNGNILALTAGREAFKIQQLQLKELNGKFVLSVIPSNFYANSTPTLVFPDGVHFVCRDIQHNRERPLDLCSLISEKYTTIQSKDYIDNFHLLTNGKLIYTGLFNMQLIGVIEYQFMKEYQDTLQKNIAKKVKTISSNPSQLDAGIFRLTFKNNETIFSPAKLNCNVWRLILEYDTNLLYLLLLNTFLRPEAYFKPSEIKHEIEQAFFETTNLIRDVVGLISEYDNSYLRHSVFFKPAQIEEMMEDTNTLTLKEFLKTDLQ